MQTSAFTRALERFVLESAGEAIIVLDARGILVAANRAARELLPDHFASLLTDDSPYAEELSEFRACLGATGWAKTELRHATAGGPRHLLLEGTTVEDHRFLVLRDQTAAHAHDEELQQLRRVESAGLLTLSVLHDLGNLLTPILVLSERLAEDAPDDRFEPRAVARQISVAADRAAELARQLLAFGRCAGSRAKAVNTNDVLRGIQSLLDGLLPDDIDLRLSLGERLHDTLVDRGRLEHVILNLVANARDAMPQGGHVTLSTENVMLEPRHAGALGPAARGPFVALSVTDTGTGIRQEHLDRIFDRFFTTKDARGGTGLGLAMARSFVTECGGLIAVQSDEGRGTVVTLYLPHCGPTKAAVARPDRPKLPGGTETILLFDHDHELRSCVRRILEERGYAVLETATVEDVKRLADGEAPATELALIGLEPTDRHARALVKALRAPEGRGPRLLLMSSKPPDLIAGEGLEGAALPLLKKPFRLDELLRSVRKVLDADHPA